MDYKKEEWAGFGASAYQYAICISYASAYQYCYLRFNLNSSGVPEHSLLAPLLFLICVNDFIKSTAYFSTRVYLDDIILMASESNLDVLLTDINNHLWQNTVRSMQA